MENKHVEDIAAAKQRSMENTDTVPAVSVAIDHESRRRPFRHSLQPTSTPVEITARVRRSTSIGNKRPHHHHNNNNIKRPSVPDILESEKTDEDDNGAELAAVHGPPDHSRISFTKKSGRVSRASNKHASVPSTASSAERNGAVANAATNGGYVNAGFAGIGPTLSTRSSSVHGSMSSLPVMREQYCCCQRWTRLEKNLAIIVACLALVIICLIIAIGIVANHTDTTLSTYLMPLKF